MAKLFSAAFKRDARAVDKPTAPVVILAGDAKVTFESVRGADPVISIEIRGPDALRGGRDTRYSIVPTSAEGLQILGRLAMAYGFKLVKEATPAPAPAPSAPPRSLGAEVKAARLQALRDAAVAAAAHDREGREWINESLWGRLTREVVGRIDALIEKEMASDV